MVILRIYDIVAVGTTINVLSYDAVSLENLTYHLPDAEQMRYVLCKFTHFLSLCLSSYMYGILYLKYNIFLFLANQSLFTPDLRYNVNIFWNK